MAHAKVDVILVNFCFSFLYVHMFMYCMVNTDAYVFVHEYQHLWAYPVAQQ